MHEEKNTENKVGEAMNSLDGIQRATPGPFFFTRVQARLQKQPGSTWELVTSFITRPSVALAGLCMIVLLNAVAVYYRPASAGGMMALGTGQTEASYADEYGSMANNNFFYDETQEP